MATLLQYRRTLLAIVLLTALALRLVAVAWWQSRLPGRFAFGDSESYWWLGRAIARGEDYQYGSPDARIFRTPGYPAALALVFLVAGDEPSVMWGRALSALLGTLAVGGVYSLGARLFNPAAGLLAAAVAAVDPGSISMGVFVLSESLFCPLLLAQLVLWAACWQSESSRSAMLLALAAGAVAALATLARPSWLLFTPFALVLGLMFVGDRSRQMRLGLAMIVGLALVMTPWWIRSARITGHFVLTTLQVGASLYDGLSPKADGSSEMSFVAKFERQERARRLTADEARETFEYRLDRRMRDAALGWTKAHPGKAAELAAVKFLRMWNVWPNESGLSNWKFRLALTVSYLPVLILGLCGVWKFSRLGWPYVLCWLPAVYFTLLHMIFVSSIRYRQPAMLPVMVLAAAVICGHGVHAWRRPPASLAAP